MVESIKEDTSRLTTRGKEITKPRNFRFTQGQWRKHTPTGRLRAE